VSAIKEFNTAAKRVDADDDAEIMADVEFMVDKRKIVAHGPTSSQMTLFMSAATGYGSDADAIATSINFLWELMEDEDARYLKRRLLKADDKFGADDIANILTYLIEEWSGGRPTKPSSGSANSRSRSGSGSTARQRVRA
jgi:hypothetical protein